MSTDEQLTGTTGTESAESARPRMRGPLPPELLQRDGRPFDPPKDLDRLRARGPVTRVNLLNGAHLWMVTGFDEARAVFTDPRFSSDAFRHRSALQLTPGEVGAGDVPDPGADRAEGLAGERERNDGMFIFMDPPEHTRLRRLLIGQFTVRRMRALESRVRQIAADHVEGMRAAGSPADLVPAFALPLPSLVICELLGVPYADRAEFQERTAVSLNLHASDADRAQASAAIYEFMRTLVADKKATPADDLISGLAHGDADPPLTDEQLVDIATVLLGAGHETTANMLALSTFALLEHPEQLDALRADPGLIDTAVEELLRYLSIIHTGPTRVATEDLAIGDVTIPAGDTVMISVPEANRDSGRWPEPARLDLARQRNHHLAFGHGIHQCLGQQLARVELRVGLTELLSRLPGLRLAVPAEEISLRTDMVVFGVHSLPVAWS